MKKNNAAHTDGVMFQRNSLAKYSRLRVHFYDGAFPRCGSVVVGDKTNIPRLRGGPRQDPERPVNMYVVHCTVRRTIHYFPTAMWNYCVLMPSDPRSLGIVLETPPSRLAAIENPENICQSQTRGTRHDTRGLLFGMRDVQTMTISCVKHRSAC